MVPNIHRTEEAGKRGGRAGPLQLDSFHEPMLKQPEVLKVGTVQPRELFLSRKGKVEWSEPIRVTTCGEHGGKATPDSMDTRTRSSTLQTWSTWLLVYVYHDPTHTISLRARSTMQSLNYHIRWRSTLAELLSSWE